jgi:hypothetical protein
LKGLLFSGNGLKPSDDLGVLLVEGLGFDALLFVDLLQVNIVLARLFVLGINIV